MSITNKFATLSALLSIVTGFMVLAGWFLDIPSLKSILPVWVSMKANTALCFVLMGVALLCSVKPVAENNRLTVFCAYSRAFCLAGIVLIALLTLSEYLFAYDIGVDQFLIHEPANTVYTSHPGRMAPETAVCFVLLASALWLMGNYYARWIALSASLSLLALNLAMGTLLIYLTPQLGVFGWFGFTSMAVHTGVLFAFLAISLLAITWQYKEYFWSVSNRSTLALICGTFLIVFIGLNTSRCQFWLTATNRKIALHKKYIIYVEESLEEAIETQDQTHGYLFTGHSRFLQMSTAASQNTVAKIADFLRFESATPELVMDIHAGQIQAQVRGLLQLQQQLIAAKQNGIAAAQLNMLIEHGADLLVALHGSVNHIKNEHQNLIEQLKRDVESVSKFSYSTVFIGSLISFLIFMLAIFKLNREETQRKKIEHLLKERVKELEAFYWIGKVAENKQLSIDELYQELAEILPQSWQYPDLAYTRIVLNNQEFCSRNYKPGPWQQSAPLLVYEQQVGYIEVGYLEPKPAADEGPFLKEERYLLDAIAERLGHITERKRAEMELRESEQNYKTLADSGQALIWVSGVDKLCNYFNSTWLEFTGRSYEQEFGNGWAEGVHPDDLQHCLDVYLESFERRERFSMEYRLRHHSGEYRWLLDEGAPRYNRQGEFIGYIGHCLDITERKQAEAKLMESQKMLQAITDNTNAVIFIKDLNGCYLFVNRLFERLFDVKNSQIHGLTDHDIFPQPMADKFVLHDKTVLESGHPITIEEIAPHDTDVHTYLSVKVPLKKLSGEIYALCGIATDITERKQAEQALLNSEQKFKMLAENSPLMISILSPDGRFLYFNKKGEELFGYTHAELLTVQDWYVRAYPDPKYRQLLVDEWEQRVASAQANQTSIVPMESMVTCKNGSTKIVEWGLVSVKDVDIVYGLDLTERKAMENQLRASEARFRAIINASPVPMALNNANQEVTFLNPAFVNTFGYTLSDIPMLSDWWHKAYPDPAYRELLKRNWQAEIERSEQEQQPFTAQEVIVRCKNNSQKFIVVSAKPLSESFDNEHLVVLYDMTERKQAENELRIAATAFEAQEGMSITDANGTILRVNQAFSTVTGYSAAEVIGKNPRLLKSGRHDADFYKIMWDSIIQTGSWRGEIWNKRKNGEIYPEYLTITAVKSTQGVITNYVATFLDITVSKAAAEEIERLAFYDPLTGLPNRLLLRDRLKLALAASRRTKRKGALLFIDMDNFKNLNDTLGHDVGDLLLQQVGQRLSACLRDNDTVARLGGDEFVVILEELSTDTEEAAAQTTVIGSKILTAINQPYELDKHTYHSSTSIGVVLFDGYKRLTDDVLKQADIAMYQAKTAGRNALRFFDPQMQASINARIALEIDLRQAIAENQFKLYCQAQVLHSGKVIGAEVLIRWQHPKRGLVSPQEFIPVAEETDLILEIGHWVLEKACQQLKDWANDAKMQNLQLAVNVSAKQFRQPDFAEQVCDLLQRTNIKPARLKLELTESLVLDDVDDTVNKMNVLRKIGVRFSMDDFGTGYSSLAYLTQLPLDQLKIDQSFVRNIGVKRSDAVIVQTIIGMANNLGMEVIAEGVETEAQRAFLEQHVCMICQGYLFSKPIPIEQFDVRIRH